jgi:pseudouridine synthase
VATYEKEQIFCSQHPKTIEKTDTGCCCTEKSSYQERSKHFESWFGTFGTSYCSYGIGIKESGFGIVFDKDNIEVEGAALQGKETVLVYKPRGLETNKTTDGAEDLHDYFPKLKHLAPIGRLDKDSEGLIIMSNDGSLARALTQENSPIGKTYEVEVRENVTDDALNKMRTGIMLDKVKTKPAEVQRLSRKMFSIVLHEGRKHQIRRMCDACHLNVESLIRTDIGHLSIGTMKPGSMRKMILDDVEKLKSL